MCRLAPNPSLYVGRVDFSFPPSAPSSVPVLPSPSEAPIHISPFDAISGVEIFDGNGGPHILLGGSSAFFTVVSIRFRTTSACTGEVEDPTSYFYTFSTPPPALLTSAI